MDIKFEDIKEIEGWLMDDEIRYFMEKAKEDGLKAEIGSWKGKSTVALASAGKKIVAIDHFIGSIEMINHPEKYANEDGVVWTFPDFYKNIKKFGLERVVIPIVANANDIDFIKDIDFLFIDGDHIKEHAMLDFVKWIPLVKPTGEIMVHDFYNITPCGTEFALKEYLQTSPWKIVKRVGSSCILKQSL